MPCTATAAAENPVIESSCIEKVLDLASLQLGNNPAVPVSEDQCSISLDSSSTDSFDKEENVSITNMFPQDLCQQSAASLAHFRLHQVPFLNSAENPIFFNCSSQIPLNYIVKNAISEFFDQRSLSPDAEFIIFDEVVEKTRALYAQLLGIPEHQKDSICFTRDSSESLHLIQQSYKFSPGDTVLVLDNEFQHNNLSWLGFTRRNPSVNVKVIDTMDDKNFILDIETIKPYIDNDPSIKIISLSLTMYQSGLQNDIKSITSYCNPKGIHTIIDLTQDVGFHELNINDNLGGCAAVFFSTFKGLFIPQGLGILYMNDKFLSEYCHQVPTFVNIKGLSKFDPNELKVDSSYPLEDNLHQTCQMFEHCNKPNLQIYASYKMLDYMLNDLKMSSIAKYLQFLRSKMEKMFSKYEGLRVFTSKHCSVNVVVTNIDNPGWFKYLRENKCYVSQFRGITRFSIGIYNNIEDIDRLEKLLDNGVENLKMPFVV